MHDVKVLWSTGRNFSDYHAEVDCALCDMENALASYRAATLRSDRAEEALRLTVNMLMDLNADIQLDPLGDIIGYARRAVAADQEAAE